MIRDSIPLAAILTFSLAAGGIATRTSIGVVT